MSFAVAMLCMHTSPLSNPGETKDAGGMNVYIHELAQELAHHHLTIDIFTRWTNENTPQVVQINPAVRVIHIKAGPFAPLHKDDLYQYVPAFVRYIEEFRRRESIRYLVLHSHYWLSGVAGLKLACYWAVPHVMMFHTLGRLKQLANPEVAEPSLRLEMEQLLIHRVDRIVATTSDEREQIVRYAGAVANQVEIVPCGVDLKLFVPYDRQIARERLGVHSSLPILVFAGRLDPFKGPDLLLRAAALMQKEARVVIVGGNRTDDKELQHLRELAEELHITQRVCFPGSRSREEMPLVYSAADVTVVPSYHESFGLAAVESLACGTPVVATRAGGLTTVVRHGETGFLVPRRPHLFAERLDQLLCDSTLRIEMSAAARPSVLSFDWRYVASQINNIYEELVSEDRCLLA